MREPYARVDAAAADVATGTAVLAKSAVRQEKLAGSMTGIAAEITPALAKLRELAWEFELIRDDEMDELACGAADTLRALADVFDQGLGREEIYMEERQERERRLADAAEFMAEWAAREEAAGDD
jgi:hypothetical protein